MLRPRVLVIDEHEDTRIIVRTIAQYGGFDVVDAAHGRRGLELALQRAPDVIVLDLDLRRPTARELIAMLRTDPSMRHAPIIALSSHRDTPDMNAVGFDAVVYKPISMAVLLAELQRLCRLLDA